MTQTKELAVLIVVVVIAAGFVYILEDMDFTWGSTNGTEPTENVTDPTNSTDTETELEPVTYSVNFTINTDLPTEPFPKTSLEGLVSSNAPYVPVELWRKLKGARDPYGEQHEWELISSTSTDSEGTTTFILNPHTGKCGVWQYKAILKVEGRSCESGVDKLTVTGVFIDVVLISDAPQRHELKICVYTSMPSASGVKVFESWDDWQTEDLTFENLVTDEAGFTYGYLITGLSGTVSFRAVIDGEEGYNRCEETL